MKNFRTFNGQARRPWSQALLSIISVTLLILVAQLYSEKAAPKGPVKMNVGQSYEVKVTSIYDGDTIKVNYRGNGLRIRFAFIDTPERRQEGGVQAERYLRKLISGKNIKIKIVAIDRYKRYVSLVYLDNQDINYKLVESGNAWHYKFFTKNQSRSDFELYSKAESEARAKKIGLWSAPNPREPWEWRREHRN